MKTNRLGVSIAALIFAFLFLALASSSTLTQDHVFSAPPAHDELLTELELTSASFFLASQDAALKLWYEMQLDGIVKKYVPEADHEAIGREIVALQGEVDVLHAALKRALHVALAQAEVEDPDTLMIAAHAVFMKIYLQTGVLIEDLYDIIERDENGNPMIMLPGESDENSL